MIRRFILFISVCLACQISVAADRTETARALFEQGQYDAALNAAQQDQSASGLTLAAEILSAQIMLGLVDKPNKTARQAKQLAAEAVALDPSSSEAQVQFALAAGFETRTSHPFRAWRKKLPQKTLAIIQAYRAAYPEDPRGDALLGAWHLGIVRKTGDKRGEKWFGAREANGVRFYENAIKAAPTDIVIAANYGVTLLSVDQARHAARAKDVLLSVTRMTPNHAVEQDVQERVNALMVHYDDPEQLSIAVDDLLDGNLPDHDFE